MILSNNTRGMMVPLITPSVAATFKAKFDYLELSEKLHFSLSTKRDSSSR